MQISLVFHETLCISEFVLWHAFKIVVYHTLTTRRPSNLSNFCIFFHNSFCCSFMQTNSKQTARVYRRCCFSWPVSPHFRNRLTSNSPYNAIRWGVRVRGRTGGSLSPGTHCTRVCVCVCACDLSNSQLLSTFFKVITPRFWPHLIMIFSPPL